MKVIYKKEWKFSKKLYKLIGDTNKNGAHFGEKKQREPLFRTL